MQAAVLLSLCQPSEWERFAQVLLQSSQALEEAQAGRES